MEQLLEEEKESRDYSEENTPLEDSREEREPDSIENEQAMENYVANEESQGKEETFVAEGGGGDDDADKRRKRKKNMQSHHHARPPPPSAKYIILGQEINDDLTNRLELMTKEEKNEITKQLKRAMNQITHEKCPRCNKQTYQMVSVYDMSRMQKKIYKSCQTCQPKTREEYKYQARGATVAIPLEYYVILNLGDVIRSQSALTLDLKTQMMVNKNNFMFGFCTKEEAEKIHNPLFRKLILLQEGFVKYLHMYMILGYGFMPETSTTVSGLMQKFTTENLKTMFNGNTKEEERKNIEEAISQNIQRLKDAKEINHVQDMCRLSNEIMKQLEQIKDIFETHNSIYGEIYLIERDQPQPQPPPPQPPQPSSPPSSLSTGGNRFNKPYMTTPKHFMSLYKKVKSLPRQFLTFKNKHSFLFPFLPASARQKTKYVIYM